MYASFQSCDHLSQSPSPGGPGGADGAALAAGAALATGAALADGAALAAAFPLSAGAALAEALAEAGGLLGELASCPPPPPQAPRRANDTRTPHRPRLRTFIAPRSMPHLGFRLQALDASTW